MKTRDAFALVLGFWLSSVALTAVQLPIAHPGDKLCWDQPGNSLADAQSLTYTAAYDGQPATAATVTCEGAASPYQCSTPIPALSNGNHRVFVTARSGGGVVFTSDPFDFTYDAPVDYTPIRLRIVTTGIATIKK